MYMCFTHLCIDFYSIYCCSHPAFVCSVLSAKTLNLWTPLYPLRDWINSENIVFSTDWRVCWLLINLLRPTSVPVKEMVQLFYTWYDIISTLWVWRKVLDSLISALSRDKEALLSLLEEKRKLTFTTSVIPHVELITITKVTLIKATFFI